MAVLSIRNLPDEVHARLRVRAARAGRSMEAEARAILADAVNGDSDTAEEHPLRKLRALLDEVYGPDKPTGVVEELIAERRREAARE